MAAAKTLGRRAKQSAKIPTKQEDVETCDSSKCVVQRNKSVHNNGVDRQEDNFQSEWQIGELLGTGSSANVFDCRPNHTENPYMHGTYAVKIFSKKMRQKLLRQAKAEVALLRKIQHPCVLELIKSYEDESAFYIIFERLDGGELFDWIVDSKVGLHETEEARPIMRNVLLALEYLHGQNIIHRDVKPENILFKRKGKPDSATLIDFGLSKPDKVAQSFVGTPSYLAPELRPGKNTGKYTSKVDIFSAGVTMFAMLSSLLPFEPDEVTSCTPDHDLLFPEDAFGSISDAAKDLMNKMLEADPLKRITARDALDHEWFDERTE